MDTSFVSNFFIQGLERKARHRHREEEDLRPWDREKALQPLRQLLLLGPDKPMEVLYSGVEARGPLQMIFFYLKFSVFIVSEIKNSTHALVHWPRYLVSVQ